MTKSMRLGATQAHRGLPPPMKGNIVKKPNITIRLGAAHNSVEVDGTVFDRSKMDKPAQSKLRRVIRDVFTELNKAGQWGRAPKATPAQEVLREAGRHAPAFRRTSRQRHRHENRVTA